MKIIVGCLLIIIINTLIFSIVYTFLLIDNDNVFFVPDGFTIDGNDMLEYNGSFSINTTNIYINYNDTESVK